MREWQSSPHFPQAIGLETQQRGEVLTTGGIETRIEVGCTVDDCGTVRGRGFTMVTLQCAI